MAVCSITSASRAIGETVAFVMAMTLAPLSWAILQLTDQLKVG
nr:hypothetical protein [Lacticaseibacillus zeae]